VVSRLDVVDFSPNRLLRTFLFVVFATRSIKILEKEKKKKNEKKKKKKVGYLRNKKDSAPLPY